MPQIGRSQRFSSAFRINGRPTATVTPRVSGAKTPTMSQVTSSFSAPLEYVFPVGITGINHEAPTVEYATINRPKILPIVDSVSPTLHRVSFQFMIVVPLDSLFSPVDGQIAILQDFASSDDPVRFSNAHEALSRHIWLIEEFGFEVTRTNEALKATQANASMRLVEAVLPTGKRFLKLPKFSYRTPVGKNGSSTGNTNPDSSESPTATIQKIMESLKNLSYSASITNDERNDIEDAVKAAGISDAQAAERIRNKYQTFKPSTSNPRAEFVAFVIKSIIG